MLLLATLLPSAGAVPVALFAGWEAGLTVCGVLLAFLAVPGLLPLGRRPPAPEEDRAGRLRQALGAALAAERTDTAALVWGEEAKLRRLDSATLLGLRLTSGRAQVDPLRRGPAHDPLPPAGLSAGALSDFYYGEARGAPRRLRAAVVGGPGSGKSTLALLLTLGALRSEHDRTFPVLLPAAAWNPADGFAAWVAEQTLRLFPSLRPVAAEAGAAFPALLAEHPDVWIVLDGLDELPEPQWEEAWRRLDEVSAGHPLLVLARPEFLAAVGEAAPADCPVYELRPCAPGRAARYLRQLTAAPPPADPVGLVRPGPAADWRPVIERLESADPGGIGEVFAAPLHLDLARRLYGTRAPRRIRPGLPGTPAALMAAADADPAAARVALMDGFLDAAFDPRHLPGGAAARSGPLPGGRAAPFHTAWLVTRTARQEVSPGEVAWWRLPELVHRGVLVAFCAVLLVLTYAVALVMPVGFTRGLAIGCTTAVTLCVLRHTGVCRRAEWIAGALAAAAVAGIGMARYGPAGALDGLQLGTAFLLVFRCRRRLAGGRGEAAATAVLLCAATAALVQLPLLLGAELPEGGSGINVFLSLLTGVGLATLACRVLAAPFPGLSGPTRVNFAQRPKAAALPGALARGVLPSFGIGAAAGATLVLQFSPQYGTALLWGFGLVLGVPVGVVAGLLFWYRQEKPLGRAGYARGSLRNDRLVLLGCVLGVTLLCTAVMAVLDLGYGVELARRGGEGPVELRVHHGTLFGLCVGLILGACYTAGLPTAVAHAWLALRGRLPWRLGAFLDALHRREILRQTGPGYRVRHDALARRLAEREDEYARRR
ncbi:hypothetical protein [Streptomyces yaizuensis]|uniref:NACHT domain-containing protein n=1 Tax=Streptomyces yaizuensis TaxID=2989713 RepID=A0ABQ5NSK5_9ACTN|nr:hypothetical protein [Streptomyces sp. YSPA8]GLF93359.1 NACHT domain-containing protein [Streptomyces sp. YSPA8]